MSARILLVTGSRALEGSAHEERARAILSAIVFSLSDGAVVVTGDARGPDEWAAHYAGSRLLSLHQRIYSLDGWVYDEQPAQLRRWRAKYQGESTPLARNVAMVAEVARQRDRGAEVLVLGLEAKWSATQGTAHTLAAARAQRFEITRVTFDMASKNAG